jgi:hypothetical protein
VVEVTESGQFGSLLDAEAYTELVAEG